ncbi:MAG: SBBP repeat-containing protein [Methanothrix sp.]
MASAVSDKSQLELGQNLSLIINNSNNFSNDSIQATMLKLPLSFIKNKGQSSDDVKFMVKTSKQTVFFAPSEVVFALSSGNNSSVVHIAFEGSRPGEITGEQQLSGRANFFIGNDSSKWSTEVPTYGAVRYKDLYPGVDLVFKGTEAQLKHELIVSPGADPAQIILSYSGQDYLSLAEDDSIIIRTATGNITDSAPFCYQEINGSRVTIDGRYRMIDSNRISFDIDSYNKSYPLVLDPTLRYSTYLGGSSGDGGQSIAVDSSGNAYLTGYTGSTNFPIQNSYQSTYEGNGNSVFITKLDPVDNTLIYSTYLEGSAEDWCKGIAVDDSGNAYVTGYTTSKDFPIKNPYQETRIGGPDVFVTKLNPAGNTLVYSTYLGGSSANYGFDIAVDSNGNAYVTGDTVSTDFPTQNPYQSTLAGNYDVFVTKLNPAGNVLVYSTYLGGSVEDDSQSIAVDGSGNAYITGYTRSFDFPIQNPYQNTKAGYTNAFVTKLNPGGDTLAYSTYLGGSDYDIANGIAVDRNGSAYVTGYTTSIDFPIQNPYQSTKAGGIYDIGDAIVTKLSPDGDTLVYSTYLGGSDHDVAEGIAIDDNSNAYVTGYTSSTNFPTQKPYQGTNAGSDDAFITKLSPDGNTLVYSTYQGGNSNDEAYDIAVYGNGSAYVTGYTSSTNFPTQNPYQSTNAGSDDAFMAIASDDSISNEHFEQVELISVDGEPVHADEDANIILTITNTNANDIPESGWYMEIDFRDLYNRGLLDLPLTTYLQKSTLVQQRKMLVTIPVLKPGENKITIPISLSTLDLKNDYHLSFANKLDIYGCPSPSSIDYSNLNHQAHTDISIMSASQGNLAECGWGVVKLVIKGVVRAATKGIPLDAAGLEKSYKFFADVGFFAGDALLDGVFNKEDLKNLVMESLKLLWSLVKIVASITCPPCNMAIAIIDFIDELHSGWSTLDICADVIGSIAFDVISYFNNLGVHVQLFEFRHGTEITITNSLGQVISIANGSIRNDILNSSAFYTTDGEVVLIPGNDSLSIQMKGTNTSTMEIRCAVPVGDNQSLSNQYEIPVIQGTILTTTYTNTSGVEPIKVDTQGDGTTDQIVYPQVVKYGDHVVGMSSELNAIPSIGAPESNVEFTINVTNIGNVTLNSVKVIDYLPVGLSYLSDNRSGTISGRNITWDILTPLGNGSSAFIQLAARIDPFASGSLKNLVEATGIGATDMSERVSSEASSVVTINTPPNIPSQPTGPTTGVPETSYNYSMSANDPDGDLIAYTFDWGDGATSEIDLIDSGTIANATHSWNKSGTYQVKAMATDSKGASSEWSGSLNVTINTPPSTPAIPSGQASGIPGTSYSYSTSALDPDGDLIAYTFDWGDGMTSETDLIDSGTITNATHSWNKSGIFQVKAMATDNKDASSEWSGSLNVTINTPPNTPTIPSGQASGIPGTSYSYSTSASDPDGDQVKYTFDWGDGTNSMTSLVNSSTVASASHTWTNTGIYQVKAKATDSKGLDSEWSNTINVSILNRPPNAPDTPIGVGVGFALAPYSYATSSIDPDGDEVSYTFDWGDKTTTNTSLVKSGTEASASHTWSTAGSYLVKANATDSKGAASGDSSSLSVTINPNKSPNAPSKPSGSATCVAGSSYSYSTSATDPDKDQVKYSFNWGDGTKSETGLVKSGTKASATHTWSTAGTYQVKANATDSKGAVSGYSSSLTVTVNPNKSPKAPSKPSGSAKGYASVAYSYTTSATDPDKDQVKYTFDWGDGTKNDTNLVNSGTKSRATHAWNKAGTYLVKANATDSKGAVSGYSGYLSVTISPNGVPDTPSVPTGTAAGKIKKSYSYTVSSTDPDGDKLKYTIDWGDGKTSMTSLVKSGTSASSSHAWSKTGTYQVKAIATDSKGASSVSWSSPLAISIT